MLNNQESSEHNGGNATFQEEQADANGQFATFGLFVDSDMVPGMFNNFERSTRNVGWGVPNSSYMVKFVYRP